VIEVSSKYISNGGRVLRREAFHFPVKCDRDERDAQRILDAVHSLRSSDPSWTGVVRWGRDSKMRRALKLELTQADQRRLGSLAATCKGERWADAVCKSMGGTR